MPALLREVATFALLAAGAEGGVPPDSLGVTELGRGSVTVIVLHGGPGFSHRYLRPEFEQLALHHRVVFYDQRGCGRSALAGAYGWEQHVADLHGIVARYRGRGPVALAGSSWGSWLALLYAWKHPGEVAALVLSGTPPWPLVPAPVVQLRPRRRFDGLPGAIPRLLYEAVERANAEYQAAFEAWREAQRDSIEAGLLPPPFIDSATIARGLLGIPRAVARRMGAQCLVASVAVHASFRQVPQLRDLSRVAVPVLIVRGTRATSHGDGAPALMRVLPRAALVTLMGAGHDPWFDRREQFFAHVERFLHARVARRASTVTLTHRRRSR